MGTEHHHIFAASPRVLFAIGPPRRIGIGQSYNRYARAIGKNCVKSVSIVPLPLVADDRRAHLCRWGLARGRTRELDRSRGQKSRLHELTSIHRLTFSIPAQK